MLPKINRLRKTKEIKRVFKEGGGHREGFLFLRLVKNNLQISRFGFVVSQGVAKKSTLRNKIKRRLRELVRTRLPRIKTGFDVVIIAQPGSGTKNFQDTEKNVENLFKKAKLF